MITESIKDRIKRHFLINPTARLRVRQIERAVKVPLPSAIRYARELEKEGILRSTILAEVKTYSADRASRRFLAEKRFFNLSQLLSSGLIDSLITEYSNPNIVVFGSYSRGEDTEDSDIDIYMESAAKGRIECPERFQRRLQRNVHIIVHRNLHDIGNKELANNIINGVVVNGFIEVFR